MATFLRTNSASSISSIGSDNADAVLKSTKNVLDQGKSKNIVQRTRDALGDIGNRLKKNPTNVGGKALAPSNVAIKKPNVTSSGFAVPVNRPPRAVSKPKAKTVEKRNREQPATFQINATEAVEAVSKPEAKTVEKENSEPATIDATEAEEAENEYNPKLNSEAPVEAFSSDRLNIVDIDVDESNPLLVQVYIKEIYNYVFALEKKYPIRVRYLEGRSVNSRMRGVLLDWLIEVHAQFGFMPETLYLATKMLDRYLQADRNITRKQLQLVGVTAMYVAAKYEEVCTPAVQDFAAVSDNAFTVADVRKMEQDMLTTLSFDLAFPPAVLFLRRFSKAANATMSIHSMAKYIMELSLVDYAACHLFPSEQAAASLALALLILEGKSLSEVWTPTLQHHSRNSLDAIKPLVSILAGVLSRAHDETHKLKAVYKKYTGKRLNQASLAPELKEDSWKHRVLKEVCKV